MNHSISIDWPIFGRLIGHPIFLHPLTQPFLLPDLSQTSKASHCYAIRTAIGLNRIILLSNIQATEANAQSVTPPHPKSKLHDVINLRAFNMFFGTGPPTTPSSGPSRTRAPPRSCALLKWIIVRVKSAKVAETYDYIPKSLINNQKKILIIKKIILNDFLSCITLIIFIFTSYWK